MTTSRIVRGNKGRIFAYVLAVVFITGVIACYNNTLSQLDEAKLGKEVCQRESENLSTQLQSKFNTLFARLKQLNMLHIKIYEMNCCFKTHIFYF